MPGTLKHTLSSIGNFLTTPLPGFGRITGTYQLKKSRAESQILLDDSIHREEMDRIKLDRVIMSDADLRDADDREIQRRLFGRPVFNKEKRIPNITTTSPDLQPILDAFIELEKSKDLIRHDHRPNMVKQIKLVEDTSQKTPHHITRKLKGMYDTLQQMRLEAMDERAHMMELRSLAYQAVDELTKTGTVTSQPDYEGLSQKRARSLQEVKEFLAGQTFDLEKEIEERIQNKTRIYEEHHRETKELNEQIQEKHKTQERVQHAANKRRAMKWVSTLGGIAIAAEGLYEGTGYVRSRMPYSNFVRHQQHVLLDVEGQALPVFNYPYHTPFDLPSVKVAAHSIENIREGHAINTTRLLDLAYQGASGDPNPPVDYAETSLNPMAHYLFIDPRPQAIKDMMTSTNEFHVFATATTSDMPGTKNDRNFLLKSTCPIGVPSGNEALPNDIVTEHSQHIGALSHYPRYAMQVGEIRPYEEAAPIETWYKGPLEVQVEKFCKFMASYKEMPTVAHKVAEHKAVYEAINHVLGLEGEQQLTHENIADSNKLLVDKISEKFLGEGSKLEAFLDAVKAKASGLHPFVSYKDGLSVGPHNHPYPFISFPLIQRPGKYLVDIEDGVEVCGSSMEADEYPGHIAAIKSKFPQLSWDNIVYAVALGSYKQLAIYPPKDDFLMTSADNDLTYSKRVGYGIPDPELIEKICWNMLYQRILNPEIKDNPEALVNDDKKKLGKTHHIVVPADKGIFKMVLEMVPLDKTKETTVTFTEERHNTFEFQVEKLCRYMGSINVSTPQREKLATNINELLDDRIEPPLTAENIVTAKDALAKAIAAKYPDAPDKQEAFMKALISKMGKNDYLLKTYQDQNAITIKLVKGQPISRFTAWHHLAQQGGKFTITSSEPIKVNPVIHVNDPLAITLGLTRLSDLKSIEEIKTLVTAEDVKALPISMPIAPVVINEVKQRWR